MNTLRQEFSSIRETHLDPCASALECLVKDWLFGVPRVDRVTSRVKSVDRFVEKASKVEQGSAKYKHPLIEIQDIIGLRIIVLFLDDVTRVRDILKKYLRSIEEKSLEPNSASEFSYFGWHGIFFIPSDCFPESEGAFPIPKFFEVQVKTVFQHAWSEAEHDLGYKPISGPLSTEAKRMVAFAASLSWGADRAFQDVMDDLVKNPH